MSLIFFLLIGGCSQPLRTLMALGKEQQMQRDLVARQKSLFARLLKDAEHGRLRRGESRARIVARYGEPVLEADGTCLYRDPVGFFDSPKVYLDFDEKDGLADIRIEKRDGR